MTDKLAESTGFGTNIPVDGSLTSPANIKGKLSIETQTSNGRHTNIHSLVETSPQGCREPSNSAFRIQES
jgi:hypothetical protein